MMLFSSIGCFARVKWNEYHEEIIYFNYEGQNIVLKDLPSLPSQKIDRVDVRDINLSSLMPMGQVSSGVLDSLLRESLMEPSLYKLHHDEYAHDSLVFKVLNKRIEIIKTIDSYLVYTLGFTYTPTMFLVNMKNGCLQSIMLISGRVSIEKIDALTAVIRKGRISLFENGYCSLVNVGWRYVSNQSRHLTDFQMDENGRLSVIKNHSLIIPRDKRSFPKCDSSILDSLSRMRQSDTLEYVNYSSNDIVLSDLPKCHNVFGRRIDIKKVISTPLSRFTQEETELIGPALCQENWTENVFFWLKRVHCRRGLKSYLVLVNPINGYGNPRLFLVNFNEHRMTSVVNASFIGGQRDCYQYRHSLCRCGRIAVFNDYGEKAVSPMKVVRDYSEEKYSVIVDYEPYDMKEEDDVIHDFNLYEANMPKSSKYVLLLDKDGFVTRQ